MAVNYTDPYIFHDPVTQVGRIATVYEPQDAHQGREDEDSITYGARPDYDSEKVNGILYPVILVNNKVISYDLIEKFVLYYEGFAPSLMLVINDPNRSIQATDVPGLNSKIRIAIVPSVDNTYKSIRLEFKIDDVFISGEHVTYTASYRSLPFMREYTKELVYPGCSNSVKNTNSSESYSCNSSQNNKPNTWEYLHIIAHECGLGFMSTNECQTIEDRMPRLMSNEKYPEFINKHIQWGGLDENSIFDCWIDLYGYIVLVNVSWIFNKELENDSLKIYAAAGIQSTDHNIPKPQTVEVSRVITNWPFMNYPNNMIFDWYKTIVDNSDLDTGTAISQYQFNMIGVNSENVNGVSQYDVRVVQNSADGMDVAAYNTEKLKSIVIEFNELNTNKQKTIRNKFFSKHRHRKLEVALTQPNLGLQRGTLIGVTIFESNPLVIPELTSQISNLNGPSEDLEPTVVETKDSEFSDADIKFGDSVPMINFALSGYYYIDAMRFEYNDETQEIKQYLILLKKDSLTNFENLSTMFKTGDAVQQENLKKFVNELKEYNKKVAENYKQIKEKKI